MIVGRPSVGARSVDDDQFSKKLSGGKRRAPTEGRPYKMNNEENT